MTEKKTKELQNLATVCRRSGILPIFLGILVIFIGAVNGQPYTITVGLLMFIVGYSYVKVAQKIENNI